MNITSLELRGKLVKLKIQRFKDGRSTYDIYEQSIGLKTGNCIFYTLILMDSGNQLAMNLDETYLVTESVNERLSKQKLDFVIL